MADFETLRTTAEVSVAFAGFIGIFLVLARRDGRFPPADAYSIRLIVICGVAPVFYSALPLVLNSLGLSGTMLWRISSGIIGLVGAILVADSLPRQRALPAEEQRFPMLVLVLAAAALVCFFANAAGWPWEPSGGMHLLATWLVIGMAGGSFVRLILSRVL